MIDDNIEISELFNKHVVNNVEKLGLFRKKKKSAASTENSVGKVEKAVGKYGNHPSIIVITKTNGKTW